MFDFKSHRNPKFVEAILVIATVFIILGGMIIFVPNVTPHIPILIAIVFLLIYGLMVKVKYDDMQKNMVQAVMTSMGAIYLFFFIGILVTAFMMSGAIPTLIYYGLNIISAKTFYLSAFLITALIGVTIGSSLTTVATLGVALIGISSAFNSNPAITAGAIVSGAFFGDKMSPLSDTTSISASVVGIDLFTHIKNMMKTTIPVFIISVVFYGILSFNSNIDSVSNIAQFKTDILNTGLVHQYALIPFIVLIVLVIFKIPAVVSIIITSFTSLIITYMHSSYSITEVSSFFYSGYRMENLSDSIASLIQRGGLESMFFTLTIVLLALSLGGLLFGLGIISTLLEKITSILTNTFRATFFVSLTAVFVNYIVGEQYLGILLTGKTFKPVYDRLKIPSKSLSRTLEDSGTVINPLVPWGVCGTFIANTLGVSVLEYLPFAIFCYGSLIVTLLSNFIYSDK